MEQASYVEQVHMEGNHSARTSVCCRQQRHTGSGSVLTPCFWRGVGQSCPLTLKLFTVVMNSTLDHLYGAQLLEADTVTIEPHLRDIGPLTGQL